MDERYGPERAEYLRGRIADIRAAGVLADVPLMEIRPFESAFGMEIWLDLGKGLKVLIIANQKHPPKLPGGNIDWMKVERALIQEVEFSDV